MGETREEVTSEDMISVLPEDILVSILMRVPIKDAVTTMILSKRWRFIWTMMPKLDYKDDFKVKPIFGDKRKKSVWWLLDKSMQLHKAPVLDTLLIKLGSRCPSDADVGKWIAKAVDCSLVTLEFDLLWSVVDPTRLPKTLYLCESLKTLKLSHKILVDVLSTACLPSLTKLGLNSVVYKNEDSLINLLASCPILESLSVRRRKYDNVRKFTVKSPCLLDLSYAPAKSSYDVEEDTGRCFLIDTPPLTEFYFSGLPGETCSIQNQQSCFEKFVLELDLRWFVVDPISLLKTLYLCESLKILKLSNQILVDVPSTTTARLPSLTTLVLNSVVYKNEDSLVNLLASCPILESLSVRRRKYDNVRKFTVKSPSLLALSYATAKSSNDVEEDIGRCLVIDTLALTKLDFCDRSGETCSIENQSSFEQVSIRSLVGWSFPDTDKFLRSFSTVSSLVLGLSEEMVVCCGTIKFPRLIDCTIFPLDTDWTDSFVSFLQNTPKLKSLTVNYENTRVPPMASMSWRESSYDPECLSSSLEKFELVDFGERQEEIELVEYFLTNAKCLKIATISMRSPFTLADKDTKITMMKYLRTIPRVSKTCKLLFKTL